MKITSLVLATAVMAATAAFAQDGPAVIKAATIFDGKGGILRNTAIVVNDGRIVRLDPSAQGTVYDLTGLTIMPGWIETHAHIASHFDRDTGRIHNEVDSRAETLDQSDALHDGERLPDTDVRVHHGSEPRRRDRQESARLD